MWLRHASLGDGTGGATGDSHQSMTLAKELSVSLTVIGISKTHVHSI